ncbi:MAG: hypothetical protein COA57_15385, partial [Flavobacteriales bacterium]
MNTAKQLFGFLIFTSFFTCQLFAKTFTGSEAEAKIVQAKKIIIDDESGKIKFVKLKPESRITFDNLNSWLKETFRLDDKSKFAVYKTETDRLGFTHYRLQQYCKQYPVEGGVLVAHFKNGYLVSINGEYFQNISLPEKQIISEGQALFQAINQTKAKRNTREVAGELVILPFKNQFNLCWKFDVYTHEPLSRAWVFTDAETGKIIHRKNRLWFADANGTAVTKYSGNQAIVTDSIAADTFRLRETGRGGGIETYDMNEGFLKSNAVDFIDSDNFWNNTNAQQDEAATDAHWGAEMFYDYLDATFSRNSYDNTGSPLFNYVHYSTNYGNAFWDGSSVSYGDGDGATLGPLTSLDIVAHEFTHGMIESTANFVFSGESGALSESFADIFATLIEFYAKPSQANWLLQDEVYISGGAKRSMLNPNAYSDPDTYLGTNWYTGGNQNIFAHTNCGVGNFWFYLLANGGSGVNDNGDSYSVTGIGMTDAAQIVYRALTVYHTSSSTYNDARTYAVQAATDLFASCSPEVSSVEDAWYAVGIGAASSFVVVTAGFTATPTYACSVPATINFINASANATTYFWDFGDGTTSTAVNPNHVYTDDSTYTVMLIATGIAGCGSLIDTLIQVNYITVDSAGGPISASCTPATTGYCCGYGITNVTFGAINNTTNDGVDGYQDYTCTQSATLTAGDSYNISVTTGSTEDVRVWIDYDNSGVFNNTNELVFVSDDIFQSHSGTVQTPVSALLNTPLRMRVVSEYYLNTITDACTNVQYGQAEDYTVTFQPNTLPPSVDFTADQTTITVGGTVNFTDLSINVPTAWSWDLTGGTPTSSTQQNPSVVYNTLGTYPVKLVASNSFGSDSLTKTNYINVTSTINLCGGTTSTTSTSGTLYDSGGPAGSYTNNENCSLLINPGCATSITLTFNSFWLESCCDYVRVYDGTSTSGTLLLQANGTTIPSPVTATSGAMYIWFTSDGSVVYSGFDVTWTSTTPSSGPAVAFAISDTNPPLNSTVNFTDLTTNLPGSWFWDFGDGNTSTAQNPSHVYISSGTYYVTLIADNCFSTDTITDSLVVQTAPLVSVNPTSLNTTLLCGDTITLPLTVYNTGGGDLIYEITYTGMSTGNSIFYNGFESGNISTWFDEGGTYTKQISTTAPAAGSYGVEMINGVSGHLDGLSHTFTSSTPDYASFKIKNTSTTEYGSFVVIGNNPTGVTTNTLIYLFMSTSGQFYINTTYYGTYSANQWYQIELQNIDWTAKTYDLYLDGVLLVASLSFRDVSLTSVNEVHLYKWTSTSTAYFDDITIGNPPNVSWISTSLANDTVVAGDSSVVDVTFNAAGLMTGTYPGEIQIASNDSANSPIVVPCTLTVTGQPVITLSDTCLDLGSVMVGLTNTDSVTIYNNGCDSLVVTNIISSSSADFSPSTTSFVVQPYDSATVYVTFAPSSVGTITSTLQIFNSDVDTVVCLTGIGLGAPSVSVNPDTISASVNCSDSVIVPLTVYNSGQGDLIYDVTYTGMSTGNSIFYDGFESGNISTWVDEGGTYTKQISTTAPAAGSYGVEMINGVSGHLDGLSHTFTSSTPDYASFKIKNTSTTEYGSFVVIGNNPT